MTDSLLWHYTSPAGALGILREKAVRATMIHYLNDAREFNYALDFAKEVIQSEAGSADSDAAALCGEFLDRIRNMAVYVASFSERRDDLSQWRAYGPPDGGHAICFDASTLAQAAVSQGFQLLQCIYAREKQLAHLRPIIARLLEEAKTRSDSDFYDSYAQEMAVAAAQLKHNAFEAEAEWRLVAGPMQFSDALEYRENGALLIPFRKIQLVGAEAIPIVEVMVGPHRHPELAARSLRMLTGREFGWPVKVTHSGAPFRRLN